MWLFLFVLFGLVFFIYTRLEMAFSRFGFKKLSASAGHYVFMFPCDKISVTVYDICFIVPRTSSDYFGRE